MEVSEDGLGTLGCMVRVCGVVVEGLRVYGLVLVPSWVPRNSFKASAQRARPGGQG